MATTPGGSGSCKRRRVDMRSIIAFTLLAGAALCGPSHAQQGDNRVLLPVSDGAWQVFVLPRQWILEHLPKPQPAVVYVSLLPAHTDDILQNQGACAPPQRIVLGLMYPDRSRRERTHACLHLCGMEQAGSEPYRGLWGSETHLEGMTATLRNDGSIDLIEHYRKLAFMTPEVAEDPNVVNKRRFEEAPKRLHRIVSPKDFRFSGRDATSCVAGERKPQAKP